MRRTEVGMTLTARRLLPGPAQQLAGDVAEPRRLLAQERQRAADSDRRQAEARRHEAVEHALAELRGDARGKAETKHLLHDAVADRDAAGHSEMAEGRAGEAQEAEKARASAIDHRDPPQQPHRGEDHEGDVDDGARRDRRYDRDLLCRAGDGALRRKVERRDEFALGQGDAVVGLDDLAGPRRQALAAGGRVGALAVERDEVAHDAFCRLVVLHRDGVDRRLAIRRSRNMPAISRTTTARKATRATSASPSATQPRTGEATNRSMMSRSSPSPSASVTRPPRAEMSTPPQDRPRRGASGTSAPSAASIASIGSSVTTTAPRRSGAGSSARMVTTSGSSSRKARG